MSSEQIAAAYADVADQLARWSRLDHVFAGPYRRQQFEKADGRVLDVACGTGRNFRYLRDGTDLVGIDISTEMLVHARDELDRLPLNGAVQQMDAQALEFPDDSFDTVISSFSTCTFPDPITALEEMQRVCKPSGQILLLEHSRSNVAPVAWIQNWRAESHYEKAGCRLNHEPLQTVQQTELTVVDAEESFFGLITRINAAPK